MEALRCSDEAFQNGDQVAPPSTPKKWLGIEFYSRFGSHGHFKRCTVHSYEHSDLNPSKFGAGHLSNATHGPSRPICTRVATPQPASIVTRSLGRQPYSRPTAATGNLENPNRTRFAFCHPRRGLPDSRRRYATLRMELAQAPDQAGKARLGMAKLNRSTPNRHDPMTARSAEHGNDHTGLSSRVSHLKFD